MPLPPAISSPMPPPRPSRCLLLAPPRSRLPSPSSICLLSPELAYPPPITYHYHRQTLRRLGAHAVVRFLVLLSRCSYVSFPGRDTSVHTIESPHNKFAVSPGVSCESLLGARSMSASRQRRSCRRLWGRPVQASCVEFERRFGANSEICEEWGSASVRVVLLALYPSSPPCRVHGCLSHRHFER